MTQDQIAEALAYIRSRTQQVPEIALVLGSGLGDLAKEIDGVSIPYSDIPHCPVATAPSHAGALVIGNLYGRSCVAMQGRLHMYEGYSAQEVVFPVRLMAALGAKSILLTNAAGGLSSAHEVGDLIVLEDHLSIPVIAGMDPTRGPNDAAIGPRFVSMNKAYDPELMALAQKLGGGLARGVYAHIVGPSFEPPVLIRWYQSAGCDVVGMSTVPEVIAARHVGMKVCAISAVTNMAVSEVDDPHVTTAEEVWDVVKVVQPKLHNLAKALIPAFPHYA